MPAAESRAFSGLEKPLSQYECLPLGGRHSADIRGEARQEAKVGLFRLAQLRKIAEDVAIIIRRAVNSGFHERSAPVEARDAIAAMLNSPTSSPADTSSM